MSSSPTHPVTTPIPRVAPDDDPADRITLRFMTLPQEVTKSGRSIAAGRVLEWIDRAGYACAVGWSSAYCVTAYVGNVHFTRPIRPGSIIAAHARIIHTGRTSMHVLVQVESADVRTRDFQPACDCILVFVAVDDAGSPTRVPEWRPEDAAGRRLHELALERIEPRERIRRAMADQTYTGRGTAPETVFRFLAAPQHANWGGKTHGGTVMRWIGEAADTCATGWTGRDMVSVYSGGIHFVRPVPIGDIVEIRSRLLLTTPRSVHVSTQVRTADPAHPADLRLTTRCMSVLVDVADGHARLVPQWSPVSDEDRRLERHARELIALRRLMHPIPLSLAAV
ncbi:acyl-CoA thioesterase [Pseudoclavibacter caeni]|jgi:acyl-CoA hydrolase|uniref:Acyl-CoA thioesterase n=1 Tax=Pseudoclavibacter caeni TaxID=908846 RepID=A0A7C8FUG4_9MICO|nr:acyl-CoA thioesterase [Pseudoclavibacter caeni]KAB1633024.1 acyl-CoA thioesterase [Pseudoclavibacter caeni]NYJ96994.1 4-hydroxybenzoyl-CoA thioesterase [Pseudoclavibacter caeni]